MPGLGALFVRPWEWLQGDLIAGLTVAAYLVPQVMAYAGVAGLSPVAGLWAILPALALYALLGSSRLLSVGPESTTALMTATVLGPLTGGDPGKYASLAATLAVTVGMPCLVALAVRLGFLADLLSRPVLVGYLAGVALVMMMDQLPRLTGVRTNSSEFFPQLWFFFGHLHQAHPPTVILAAAALVFLFAVAHFLPVLPGPLLTVVIATAAVVAFDLDGRYGIAVIGPVPSGLPDLALPDLAELPRLVLPALGVLLVAYTDFVLTARAFADRADTTAALAPDREFLALGAADLGAGVSTASPSGAAPAVRHWRPGRACAVRRTHWSRGWWPGWRACTTSTTTRKRAPSRVCSCTATTRLSSSPTRRTSGAGHWPRSTNRRSRFAGSF
jgi:MFS superfamily sulfate permease-like transporter